MLIDEVVPEPDAFERHQITIRASSQEVYSALWATDFGQIRSARLLLTLRALPRWVLQPRRQHRSSGRFDLNSLPAVGFGKLAEIPDQEVVFGVSGRFWRPIGNIAPFCLTDFDHPVAPGLARAAWNFTVEPLGKNSTDLATETRIVCGDAASRVKFRLYWLLVRPFSGLIRHAVLRAVKRSCEGAS